MLQFNYRNLAPGAAVAACLSLTPFAASAQQQNGVQVQVPNQNRNSSQYYRNENAPRIGSPFRITVPLRQQAAGGNGGVHVNLPFVVPMAHANSGGQQGGMQSYGGQQAGGWSFNGGSNSYGQTNGQSMGVVSTTPATGGVTNAGTQLGARASMIGGQQINNLISTTVYNMQGQNIGTVNDFVIKNGVVRYAIVESGAAFFGLIPGKQVAVPVSELQFNNNNAHLQLAMSRQQFQNLPPYNPDDHGTSTLTGYHNRSITAGNESQPR